MKLLNNIKNLHKMSCRAYCFWDLFIMNLHIHGRV